MIQENFWVLVSKKIAGEATAEECKELELYLLQNPEWQYAIQNLDELWKQKAPMDLQKSEDAYLLHINRLSEQLAEEVVKDSPSPKLWLNIPIRKWGYWSAAAAILLLVGLFTFYQMSPVSGKSELAAITEQNEISTRQGSKSKIKLPDGTIVWLNAGSKLIYTKEYGQGLREVTLTGEGFFDVVKNKEMPFIIHTDNINIRVLGTVFNVKAYPEDKQTETSLIKGSIEVTIKNRPNNKIILSPNEKLIVENELVKTNAIALAKEVQPAIAINKLKFINTDSTVAETQWVENKLVFRDETFEELAVRMERWYDVQIIINDDLLKEKRMNGNFEKETIDQAMEALKLMIPFQSEQKGNKIIIHR